LAASAGVQAQTYSTNTAVTPHQISISAWHNASGNVTIPNFVNIIAGGAFSSAPLTGLTVSDAAGTEGLTNIGNAAFQNCASLASVSLPTNTIMIGQQAFNGCGNLTSVTIAGAANIGWQAFENCYDLTSVTLTAVTNIGGYAFNNCSSLASVTIPTNTTSIGAANEDAFDQCYAMTAINVAAGNPYYSSAGGVLFNSNKTVLVEFPCGLTGSYVVPGTVTNIGTEAFGYCGVTNVDVPSSVLSIYANAFQDSSSLLRVRFAGNAPVNDLANTIFSSDAVTVYYPAYATGWSNTYASMPTMPWSTTLQLSSLRFPTQTNHVGFTITGPSNFTVVVVACTNLKSPVWTPIHTNVLTNTGTTGASYFSETGLTTPNYSRFYNVLTQ
jgi:hypothetical protein